MAEFGGCKETPAKLVELHARLQPFLLRRVKRDVEKALPAKQERILRVEMGRRQKDLDKAILNRNYAALRQASAGAATLNNILMQLKKCCNHALLITHEDAAAASAEDELRALVKGSGKLQLLDKLLTRLHGDGHRVLIFSQMVIMLDILARYLRLRRFSFQRLDGNTRAEQRRQSMDRFNAPNSPDFAFILSTRAGASLAARGRQMLGEGGGSGMAGERCGAVGSAARVAAAAVLVAVCAMPCP